MLRVRGPPGICGLEDLLEFVWDKCTVLHLRDRSVAELPTAVCRVLQSYFSEIEKYWVHKERRVVLALRFPSTHRGVKTNARMPVSLRVKIRPCHAAPKNKLGSAQHILPPEAENNFAHHLPIYISRVERQ